MSEEPAEKPNEGKADCYSASERAAMVFWQKVRAVTLRPLLDVMARCRLRPDHLTLLSAFVGLLFCPLYFWSKPAAFAMLVLHVVLDGLDGPLARHTNTASRRGSFADSMSDQLVVVASTITLMSEQTIGVLAGSVYICGYTVVVLFAMVRNALSIPYSWLVRPRFFVFAWFVVETYWWHNSIDYVLWVFNALLALKVLTGFIKIRRQI
ncbi:MAG: CDP-alcohol phosphatidyltransferase family protein [Pirellulaceae bacterium]|nr:CDP-alcohol phosphatidyltransferase family protein [Pirellulaceae bacterium]